MSPPAPEIINGWIAVLTPIAIAMLTLVNIIIAKLSGGRAAQATFEVKEVLAAQNVARTAGNRQTDIAVADIKETLVATVQNTADKLAKLQHTATDTHTLVNNNMAIQLRINAVKSRKLADITGDPIDILEAEEAEMSLKIHLAKQSIVDEAVKERTPDNDKDK